MLHNVALQSFVICACCLPTQRQHLESFLAKTCQQMQGRRSKSSYDPHQEWATKAGMHSRKHCLEEPWPKKRETISFTKGSDSNWLLKCFKSSFSVVNQSGWAVHSLKASENEEFLHVSSSFVFRVSLPGAFWCIAGDMRFPSISLTGTSKAKLQSPSVPAFMGISESWDAETSRWLQWFQSSRKITTKKPHFSIKCISNIDYLFVIISFSFDKHWGSCCPSFAADLRVDSYRLLRWDVVTLQRRSGLCKPCAWFWKPTGTLPAPGWYVLSLLSASLGSLSLLGVHCEARMSEWSWVQAGPKWQSDTNS